MKLVQRNNGIWYVSFGRNKLKSTKTKNKALAQSIFNAIKAGHYTVANRNAASALPLKEAGERYLKFRYDLSDGTLKKDRTALRLLGQSVGDETLINDIGENEIELFKLQCMERGVKRVSINAYLRHLKAFFNDMVDRRFLNEAPKIKMLKIGKQLPRFLTKKEIKQILDYSAEHNIAMYRIIIFALYTGCRREEISNANYGDILDNAFIKVTGKGNKQRTILLLPEAQAVLEDPLPKTGNIFGKSPNSITRTFKKVARACGIEDVHFHLLRHTAATNMLVNEMELSAIQKILGHTAISTTQIYTHTMNDYLADQMRKLKY